MASSLAPKIQVFVSDAVLSKGIAVKIGSDDQHINKSTASTDKSIGVLQNDVANIGDPAEVAMPGGGCKYLAETTIAAGKGLVPHSDGSLKPITGANDRVIVVAAAAAVAGDIAPGLVQIFQATATES